MNTRKRIIERANKRLDFINENELITEGVGEDIKDSVIKGLKNIKTTLKRGSNISKKAALAAVIATSACLGTSCTKEQPSYLYQYSTPSRSDIKHEGYASTSFYDFDRELTQDEIDKILNWSNEALIDVNPTADTANSTLELYGMDTDDSWVTSNTDRYMRKHGK